VTLTVDDTAREARRGVPAGRESRPVRWAAVAVVALAVSPIVVAALSLVGDRWYPVGDLSHILFRVGQVGTEATPLVGAETIKGWAHPGPLEFWLAAPLYRLTGGDPRALIWTAAAINVVTICGIAGVAWRRGRFPLLVGSMAVVAVLVHALGPERATSLWNPFLPLFPLLLTIVLAWDVALGRRRSLVWMAVSASLAAQTHVAFLTLSCLVVAWLAAWAVWWRRLVPPGVGPAARPGEDAGTAPPGVDADVRPPGPPWGPWRRAARPAALVLGVLWLPVAFDAVFDLHNPLNIAKSIATPPPTVGPVDAIGLVGRYVRPDGPWVGGAEPHEVFSAVGSGPLPVILAVVALAGCLRLGRHRRLVDVAALATLALALVAGSVPAASQIFLPAYLYLTQFLKIVGAAVWATVAWTGWRLVEPWVRERSARVGVAGATAAAVVIGATAWTWGDAASMETPNPAEEVAVQRIRAQLDGVMPADERVRVEFVGDHFNVPGPGVISWLVHDRHDVVTSDGAHGLKWGHEHRWQRGEPYDRLLTVAVYYTGAFHDPVSRCADDPVMDLVASYDPLSTEDRDWLNDLRLAHVSDAGPITPDEEVRTAELAEAGPMIAVYEGPRVCGRPPRRR
jgi:hypothetical protein